MPVHPELVEARQRAARHAPFLAAAMERAPDLADRLQEEGLDAALDHVRNLGSEGPVAEALRRRKSGLALVLALADLAGLVGVDRVTRILSDFADQALDAALADIIARRTPGAELRGFAVIALGKHGGQELNYSSDIDPIFIYDPMTLPCRPREDAADAAQRIARQLIDTMSQRDGNGYVFRMDLRLRPAAEVTPLAIPVDAALSHYESQALTWEQAAFIRSRAAAGDRVLGDYFMEALRPFIWRRSLDFGTIDEIAALTRQIRDHYNKGQTLGPGFDLKRGRGGIREVEFFTQAHQLIHGGRNPALRVRSTLDALGALEDQGIIPGHEARLLAGHYRTLRTFEHRLQMVDDQQTHSLPVDAPALDNVARLHGMADGAAMIAALQPVTRDVATVYDALIASQRGQGDEAAVPLSNDPELLAEALDRAGFDQPDKLAERVQGWRGGAVRALRTAAGRKAFEEVLPALLAAFADAPDQAAALNRFDDLLRQLPSTVNVFRLLQARPALMQTLVDILSHAPVLAESLARRGDLLDGLIDASAYDLVGSVEQIAERLAREEPGDDYQQRLDAVRVRVGEMRFALGVQLIEGRHDPVAIAGGYARVAEAAICRLADCAISEFIAVHGRMPDSEPVILALGRLGGGALTHASDLDLIFLFSGEIGLESDGRRPLGSTQYYNRLAQRIIAALSVPTAAGALYEVDTRLRPNGAQGLLAVSFASFAEYQRDQAWTWEHMALCRARVVYGSPESRARLEAIIGDVLNTPRDTADVRAAALKMREDIAAHKKPLGPLDVKLLPGGLVDLEFIVHTLQLTHGVGFHPDLRQAIDALVTAGLADAALAEANDLMTRLLVALRLVAPDCSEPPPASQALVARACGRGSWPELLTAVDCARASVQTAWQHLFGASAPATSA
ncbi:bifunctional [glutamine synthetase] adenylyltransferase/[glutamine synthetase]-adenylyl-L-tyrosine phosphorylase [Sphingomonas ursincola]|uniref:bifunctional [glutamine synthetase] adenylyltransferase/[glutamine synthetase]-adenylyl-L-tyrosine phosphorylase n=1 Tax=Sphingomonas ursincola TaxID=56361 RepID=UPI0023521599|nr:bifunctional [glutamine synthetase] adenylyltransferase/[glutamine synthetase]-adenylyl-L-tyrosine phosphorylase [Sphingomonas ursincola]MBY0620175.1 bifunctional [glutamine synthetase] adenylyltransferase/[glutamine synthetase]-adenylyl-L-tyrosine phosphorylase [Sphingomonas ursincola]